MASTTWAVIVPVKPLGAAKSRLRDAVPAGQLAHLAYAMAADTLTAALACPAVVAVLVVSDDPAARRLGELGAVVVPDRPNRGLNPALRFGAQTAASRWPDAGPAALAADLPALTATELDLALTSAATHPRAMVADAAGRGTTLLTGRAGEPLDPAYGEGSRARHRLSGAVELHLPTAPGLRQDVDTPADLAAAVRLGVGAHTRTLLESLRATG